MSETLLFRVAAGPRIGFGHLVRSVSLCHTLDTKPVVAVRGGNAARAAARGLGCSLVDLPPSAALRRHAPAVLVVDDPSAEASRGWVRAARRLQIPVAAIRDCGIGARGVDLVIDGSLCGPSSQDTTRELVGSDFMVLDPVYSELRRDRPLLRADGQVAIMLGGGVHAGYATEVAAALEQTLGPGTVNVAAGFVPGGPPNQSAPRTGPAHARALARAEVALVAGGIGLYEVSCLGIPAVAVAVAPAQRHAVRAFAALGAAVDGGMLGQRSRTLNRRVVGRLVKQVMGLLDDPGTRSRMAFRARRVVDGRGGTRVAAALSRLAASHAVRGRQAA